MTNITYFHRVVRDFYTDSSSSQGDLTPQTSQRHTRATSTPYPPSEEDSSDGESDTTSLSSFKRFTFDELIIATGYSLRYDCLRVEDDSDKVFKGWIHKKNLTATEPGKGIAVDVILLSQKEQLQDPRGWVAEVKYLRQLSHPNLVRLFGYCLYNEHQLLVYEGMPLILKNYLYKGSIHKLPWGIRMKVALGAAKGLAFLHRAQVIYQNFRTSRVHLDTVPKMLHYSYGHISYTMANDIYLILYTNVIFQKRNHNAKLSDFGLPKDRLADDKSHVASEYPTTGSLSDKSDVYNFGVLLLEILSGRQARESKESDLVGWAMPYLDRDILHVLDRSLKARYSPESVENVAKLTLQCLVPEAELRPNMDEVIQKLEHLQDSRYIKLTRDELKYSQFSQDTDTEITEDEQESEYFKIFRSEKKRMVNELRSAPGRISLTSDLWTSLATNGYISLTAHYVDTNWKLQKRVLNFRFMPTPHSGNAICGKIYALLHGWGIEKKIFSVTLDNATANSKFILTLKKQLNLKGAVLCGGEFLQIRCCSHVLNLIVQEGLKGIDGSVLKIRKSVNYFKDSQARKEKFLECVKQLSLDGKRKGLSQDVPTRWDSTYFMLESAIFFRRAFDNYKLSDSNFDHCPSEDDWYKVTAICKFLGVFYQATCVFSGQKYPTSNLYFLHVFKVKHELQKALAGDDQFMRDMATKMEIKFNKYWSRHALILAIAVVLDPRFKLHLITWAYTTLYGEGAKEIDEVKSKLKELFATYSSIHSSASTVEKSIASSREDEFIASQENSDILKGFDTFIDGECSSASRQSELDVYLGELVLDRHQEIDILHYWKSNELRFPILAMLARDVLPIPLTTVASEAAFSNGSRVVDKFHSALTPKAVEALVCSRDWMFGKIDDLALSLDELVMNLMETNINDKDDTDLDRTA